MRKEVEALNGVIRELRHSLARATEKKRMLEAQIFSLNEDIQITSQIITDLNKILADLELEGEG